MTSETQEPSRRIVLVVEDEAIIRLGVATELRRGGFEVIEAGDGEAGIRLFRGTPGIEAAILDIDLPGPLTGYDVAREIRSIRPDCTILIVSGNNFVMPGDFDEHVIVESKPLDLAKIALILRMSHADGI